MLHPLTRINVVLVRPMYPRNIGMCARSMSNMGVSRLVLIAPQCDLDYEAQQGATHAQEILRSARIYASLEEFYASEGEGVRIAMSGRAGELRAPERLDVMLAKAKESSRLFGTSDPIYLFFGAEDDGLSDTEIKDAHHVCLLPTFGEQYSMNLSHAVMLSLYLVVSKLVPQAAAPEKLSAKSTKLKSEGELQKEKLKAAHAPKYFPEETIKNWLETLGFDVQSHRVNAARTIKRLLLENEPTQDELRVLESVIQQTIRKLKS
jgi:TrmH family RNA methyltransferase